MTSCQNFIEYNSNSLEENDEKEKVAIDIEQKTDPYNDENAIDFKWSDVQEEVEENEKDIALSHFIKSLQKQIDDENFP